MSKIDELLKNEKIEWRKLGSLLDYEQPSKYIVKSTEYDDRYKTPVLTAGQTFILGFTNEVENIYKADENNPVIIFDDFTAGNHWVDFDFKVKSSAMKMLKPKEGVNLRYCYHYIQTISIDTTEHKRLWISKFSQIEIPIPSDIKIQEKIAKTLDKFTNCVTELQAELQARTKQYEYYRNLLLSEEYLNKLSENPEILGGGYRVKLTTLGEIGLFTRGNGLQKKDFISKGNPVIHYGQIYTKYNFETDKVFSFVDDAVFSKLKKAKYNDILIATTSENIEDVGKSVVWLGSEEIGFSGDMYSYRTNENSKYIAYYFQTVEFQKQKEKKVTGTKLIRIHGDDMAKFSISLPPIEIQNKVVEILDKFQSLVADTKGLLPQEIEQRQKQYEYYREKLLTFDTESETIFRQTDRQTDR
ncbi:restriction endonuclease subunit S [Peptostreptococcus stomatis]